MALETNVDKIGESCVHVFLPLIDVMMKRKPNPTPIGPCLFNSHLAGMKAPDCALMLLICV